VASSWVNKSIWAWAVVKSFTNWLILVFLLANISSFSLSSISESSIFVSAFFCSKSSSEHWSSSLLSQVNLRLVGVGVVPQLTRLVEGLLILNDGLVLFFGEGVFSSLIESRGC